MKLIGEPREWPLIAVFDIEAAYWTDVRLLVHLQEDGIQKAFQDVSSYLRWLYDHSGIDHVWAHWGGSYDFRFVLHDLVSHGFGVEIAQSGSHIVTMTGTHPVTGKKIVFADSARLLPDKAERIGKAVGLPKLDVDRSRVQDLTIREMISYCRRDCEIIVRGLQSLRDSLSAVGCDFAYTLASIATRYIRRSGVIDFGRLGAYEKGRIHPKRDLMDLAETFCEPAYFGGRCEVFKLGHFQGPLYYYDVRSSYPWSMLHELPLYPMPPIAGTREPLNLQLSRVGISDAEVEVPEDTYLPILPVENEGRLMFPTGKFRGRWTNPELLEAARQGAKVTVTSQVYFEPASFMRPFVELFYSYRQKAIQEGDAFRAYAFKILLNSAYGKTSETDTKRGIVVGFKEARRVIRDYGADALEKTDVPGVYFTSYEEEGPFRHIAAAAFITGRSRLLLHKGLLQARELGGNVYYCDTDSIVTDVELPPAPDELGAWKLEATIREAEFIAPKVYRLVTTDGETIYRCKGVPVRDTDGQKSEARFRAYLSGAGVGKEGLRGLKTDLRRGMIIPHPDVLVRGLRGRDKKRVHAHGDSTPVVLREAAE